MKRTYLFACILVMLGVTTLMHADSNPTMTRVYSAQFTPAVADTQSAATIGTLDRTFGTSGSLSVNSIISGGQAVGLQTLSNGNVIAVIAKTGSNSQAAMYNSEGFLVSSYGTSGVVDLGTTPAPRATMQDAQGRLLVAGGNASGTAGWITRVPATGSTPSAFTTGSAWQYVAGLGQQSSGKIIAVGFDGTNAKIGRYNLDGTVDTTFGSSGYVVLNGAGSLPAVTTGLFSVVVDSNDKMYVAFKAAATANSFTINNAYIARFTAAGNFDTSWNSTGVLNISALNNATSGLYIAKDGSGNFIVSGQVSPNIKVAAVNSAGGSVPGFTIFNSSSINSDTFTISNLITTSDSKIIVVGSDTTSVNMAVICLDSSTGTLNTAFNPNLGYNFFNISSPDTTSTIQAVGVAANGQLYTAGYQINSGTTIPYLSRLNNTQYVYQVAQFPYAQEQGILDLTFGDTTREVYTGVVTPYNGSYGSGLQQKVRSAIEIATTSGAAAGVPPVGDIVIGMDGFTDSSASSNMMLGWLTQAGVVDTTVNTTGFLTLANTTSSNEYLSSLLQGPNGLVYVAGFASATLGGASTRAFLRAYSTSSTSTWTSGAAAWAANEVTAGYRGIGVGYQASATRTLLFVSESATVGHISAYTSSGSLDTTFGASSSGIIAPTSYSLHMGPSFGGLITAGDELIVAYKDSSDNIVKCVAFDKNGTGLVSSWGTSGITQLFGSATTIAANNIRTTFNKNQDVIVAAVNGAGTSLLFTLLDGENGTVDTSFGSLGVLTVPVTGSTALQLQQVIGISDGTVLAVFYDDATDDTMYLARITLAGALDTTFNSQGSQPGILPVQVGDQVTNYSARIATSAVVQSTSGANQGNIVLAGYEQLTSSSGATPMVMRVYGDPSSTEVPYYPVIDTGIPGTFDAAYDLNSLLGVGSGNAIFVYPGGNTYQGYVLVGTDNGTNSKIARIDITTNTLDNTFGTAGICTLTGLNGIHTISVDANNKILAGGTTGAGTAWACQVAADGSSAVPFTLNSAFTKVTKILQQKSGRYIVAGLANNASNNIGIIQAFKDRGSNPLVTDPTFNPLGVTSAPAGSYYITTNTSLGLAGIYSIAINTDDTIVAVYANGSPVLALTVLTADGSGVVSSFNSGAAVTTTIQTDGSTVCRVNVDSSGNMYVASSYNSGATHQFKAVKYTAAGAIAGGWNSGAVTTVNNSQIGTAGVTLTDVLVTSANQLILVGYNTAGGSGKLVEVRLSSSGLLDTTWNPSGTTPGILSFDTNSATQLNASAITISGLVVSVGNQTGGTAGDPVLTYVYGDTYVTQQAQSPLASAAGVLDTTIPGGSTGAAILNGTVTGLATITGVPQKVAIYNNNTNGAIMIGSSNGTSSYVTRLQADLSASSSSQYGTNGVATLSGKDNLTDMYLTGSINSNTVGSILVTGLDAGSPWGANISADGDTITYLNTGSLTSWTAANVIRQTNNGRILVAGNNGSAGAIVAFSPVTSGGMYPIDTSFGNNNGTGIYTITGVANDICDMVIDSLERIYIAYKGAGNSIVVQRLLANGTIVDSSFSATFTTATNIYSASQIRLALDETNSQVVVAAQDGTSTGNIIQVKRFSTTNGSSNGSTSAVTLASKVLNLSDLFIDALQDIYVVGYNSTDSKSVIARVASTSSTTIALDTSSYAVSGGTPGIANVTTASMTIAKAGAYDPDKRTYLVGTDGSGNPYIARLFGDAYTSEVSEAIATATVGTIDTSLQPNNTGGIDLSAQSGWSGLAAGYKARAIVTNQNGDGTAFVAFGNGTNVIVGKVDADMNPVTAFGNSGSSNGLTAAIAMTTVNSITQDANSDIIVAGTNSGAQKVLSWTSAGVANATFATTVSSTVGTTVAQQKSGRYIVGGYDGSANGLITAFKNESAISGGSLAIDSTFGPNGNSGYYATGVNAQIDDIVIDSSDYIYFVYRDGANQVTLGKLTANGSGLVSSVNSPVSFNSGAVVGTGITATQPARIAINGAGNIVVGASTSSGVRVRSYNSSTGVANNNAVTVTATATDVLTKLVGSITSQNEFYGSIYTATPSAIVFALDSAGAGLDTGFNTTGKTTTTVQSPVQVTGLSLQTDGKLVAVGYNNAGAGSTADPILLRFYGYEYMSEYAQAPDQVAAGVLDTTVWPTTGALPVASYYSSIAALSGARVKRVYEYSNGKALLVCDNANSGADTILMRVNKDLTLDTSFNSSGYITISGKTNVSSLLVDSNSNIYVAGGTSTSWLRAYKNSGSAFSSWTNPTSNLANGAYQVATQSNNRIVLAGKGSSDGTLYGYTIRGSLDNTFGSSGIVDMLSTNPITDIAIDAYDNIITVANAAGTVVLNKVSASGLTITSLGGGTAITGAVSGSNIKNCLDTAGNIIVAAATSTGFKVARYNNNSTGTNNGSQLTITAGSSSPAWVIANIYATSDGKVTLVGYDSASGSTTAGQILVARIISSPSGISNASLVLDTSTFNVSTGYVLASIGSMNVAYDGIICADDRIMLAGSNSTSAAPYLGRVFGDTYVTYVSQAPTEGVAGTINTSFGTNGLETISSLSSLLVGGQGKAIFPLSNGGYYIALDQANSAANSLLIKTIADGTLDSSYSADGIAGSAGSYLPLGVQAMLQDGSNNVTLVGTASGAAWVKRYTSGGVADTTFNSAVASALTSLSAPTAANIVIEQTLARLVVGGTDASGKAALFAFQSLAPNGTPGSLDTTFNNTGGVAGKFATTLTGSVYSLVADSYDRLIFAVLNTNTNAVDLYRLTPTGQVDNTFGSSGIVSGAISSAAGASTVRVALDAAGHIVVAASSSGNGGNQFSVRAFDNGTSTSIGGNGAAVYAQLDITSLTAPTVTTLVTSADGYALVGGTQSGTNAAWIARITSGGLLDTTGFNPNAVGGVAGIFKYSTGGGTTAHVYNGIAVNLDGSLGFVGYENSGGVYTPTLVSVYDDPYTSQTVQSPDSKAVGTNDLTLGVSPTSTTNKGITFFGSGSSATYGQVARALGLYDNNNIVVAMDGANATSANSSIFINMFDNDGLLNPNFGSGGHATVLQGSSTPVSPNYQNQYVRDMVTFTTADGVRKAILAGYVQNTTLNTTSSLLLQYILTPGASGLDTANFGGYQGSPAGIAFGDGKQLFSVGQQTVGRIIATGLSQDSKGLLLGYTVSGKLDNSFGNNGYQSSNTGTTGIYTHAIDSLNRVVIAYNDGSNNVAVARFLADGSALDSTFTASANIASALSNSNMKVAVDGSNNVYVAAGVTGNSIGVKWYNTAGTQQNTATITGSSLGNSAGVYTIARLLVDTSGKVIVVAYDSNANQLIVIRLTSALALDTTFNSIGYITYAVAGGTTSQVAQDAIIHPDGRILVVGSEN